MVPDIRDCIGRLAMQTLQKSGFSIRELLLVLVILVGLAGVMIPVTQMGQHDNAIKVARMEMNRIASAINLYIQDTLFYPTGAQGATTYHYLYSEGPLPRDNALDSGPGMSLRELLDSGEYGGPRWNGPYLEPLSGDPWGHAYLVNVQGYFFGGERVAIISAGPDGRVDTPLTALEAVGDDLILVLDS